jgi:hypothetical protein
MRWLWTGLAVIGAGVALEIAGHSGTRTDAERNRYTYAGAATAGGGVVILLTKGISWRKTPLSKSVETSSAK